MVSINVCCVLVSHGHQASVKLILDDLDQSNVSQIVLVENLKDEDWEFEPKKIPFLFSHNTSPMGFSENNNKAVKLAIDSNPNIDYFIFINPDVKINKKDFDDLLIRISNDRPQWCSLILRHPNGDLDNNIRPFPSPLKQLSRFLFRGRNINYQNYDKDDLWASGAFLVVHKKAWSNVGGFDEGYRMYFEDVDICRRLQNIAGPPAIYDNLFMIHEGARANRKIFSKNFYWFFMSMLRYYRRRYLGNFFKHLRPSRTVHSNSN